MLAQLRLPHAEYAGVVYAAIAAGPAHLHDDRRDGDRLAATMLQPHLLHLFDAVGADVDAWHILADTVRSSRVLSAAFDTLACHADDVPDAWRAELRGI